MDYSEATHISENSREIDVYDGDIILNEVDEVDFIDFTDNGKYRVEKHMKTMFETSKEWT